jgi:5-methylcytosine-specific restriction endonuclease McrA
MRRVSRKRSAQGKAYLEFRLNLLARANYRCEHCRWKGALDIHHVVKPRARYLMSFDHCVVLCRDCHELVDAPYDRGRLLVTPLGNQRFRYEMVWAASKFSARKTLDLSLTPDVT